MSVYAIADLHGRFDLYQQVKEFLKPEDKVICLGDCGDRGPESWKTIKAVYKDPQFEYLMGNHEHVLAHAILQYYDGQSSFYEDPMTALVSDGGLETFEGWLNDGGDRVWAARLLHLPKTRIYENESGIQVILSHAGFTPKKEGKHSTYNLLWDREHMEDDWPKDKEYQRILIVHGHTPIGLVDKNADSIIWYGQGHKIDIDCGSVWTGVTCLLDLDTFDEHYFCAPEIEGE